MARLKYQSNHVQKVRMTPKLLTRHSKQQEVAPPIE